MNNIILFENFQNDIKYKYDSFSKLTDNDLYNIAKWGLENDFSSNGALYDVDIKTFEDAIISVVNSFKFLLKDNFPDGFNNIPIKNITIYRFIVLNDIKDLNMNNLGYSWFSNPDRINNPYFKQQLLHLKTNNLFLLKAEIDEDNIDIPRSLFQRDMVWIENEIVLKNDSNKYIKNLKVEKIK